MRVVFVSSKKLTFPANLSAISFNSGGQSPELVAILTAASNKVEALLTLYKAEVQVFREKLVMVPEDGPEGPEGDFEVGVVSGVSGSESSDS